MKPEYFFSVLFLFCVVTIQAQDRIITLQNDTIHCRIVSISNGRIYYEQPGDNKFMIGKSLPADQVNTYFRSADSPMEYNQTVKQTLAKPLQYWRFGVQGGIGYMLESTADSENELTSIGVNSQTAKDLCKNLNWGYSYSADVHYLFNHWGGIGIRYSGFYSAADADITINIFDGINYLYTNMEKRVYINFVGPSFFTQYWLDQSNTFKFTSSIALGYAHYRDEEEYDYPSINNYLATGSTFGGNVNASFEYFPLSWLSVGVTGGYYGAWFGKITASDGNNKQTIKLKDYNLDKINTSHLNLFLGVKFYL